MQTRKRGRYSARVRELGFALLDVLLAATLLTIGTGGFLMVIVSQSALISVDREGALAQEAARAMIERIQETPFEEIFASYDADPADDPLGPGTAPGRSFAVRGLTPQAGDLDGLPGDVLFPTRVVAAPVEELREDFADIALGMPRDLDADGAIDAADHSGDYVLLPVRVRIQWTGKGGNRTLVLEHLLTAR